MATKIRLKRLGRRNRPFFRVIVIDSRKRRDGAAIEEVGWYDPIKQDSKNYKLEAERILHWLNNGAQPTFTVRNLMKKEGLLYRWHLMRQGLDEKTIDQEMQKWAMDREIRLREKAEKTPEKSKKKTDIEPTAEETVAEAEAAVETESKGEGVSEAEEEIEEVTPEDESKTEAEPESEAEAGAESEGEGEAKAEEKIEAATTEDESKVVPEAVSETEEEDEGATETETENNSNDTDEKIKEE